MGQGCQTQDRAEAERLVRLSTLPAQRRGRWPSAGARERVIPETKKAGGVATPPALELVRAPTIPATQLNQTLRNMRSKSLNGKTGMATRGKERSDAEAPLCTG